MAEISAIYDTAQYDDSEYDTIIYSGTIPGLAFLAFTGTTSQEVIAKAFLYTKTLVEKPRVYGKISKPFIFINKRKGMPFVFSDKNYKR